MEVLRSSEFLESLDLSVVPNPVERPPRASTIIPRECGPDLSEFIFPPQEPCLIDYVSLFCDGSPINGAIPGTCIICSLVDEHGEFECPYQSFIPKNATVSSCDIVCKVCDQLFSGRCSNQDGGRAKIRLCHNCMMFGDHWASQCPKEDRAVGIVDGLYFSDEISS
ncbi:PREDICTED: uncharacterized protein LOC101292619 [Fragaria vesca subsp. vesca]|uniref:uncharacterized protein LOC101292619 n=1 Tax=Fragaria vesca subsp. vesca TaxID=101020 RepID=UPI0002C31A64|nr:PREDICTED: uncharacterized protein LOC101292619 [Fragaria vesca subsp. vesca]